MKLFDYTFYRVCDFYKKKKDSAAEMTAALIVSLLQFFSILNILIFVRILWQYPIPESFSKYWFLPLIILLPILNWNKYVKSKKYRKYRLVWNDENEKSKRSKGISIVLYITISIMIPILYGLIKHNIMEGKSFFG